MLLCCTLYILLRSHVWNPSSVFWFSLMGSCFILYILRANLASCGIYPINYPAQISPFFLTCFSHTSCSHTCTLITFSALAQCLPSAHNNRNACVPLAGEHMPKTFSFPQNISALKCTTNWAWKVASETGIASVCSKKILMQEPNQNVKTPQCLRPGCLMLV